MTVPIKNLNNIADEHYNLNNSFSPSHVIVSSSITIINNIFTFINYYKLPKSKYNSNKIIIII